MVILRRHVPGTWRPSGAGTRTPRSPGWRATRRRRCGPRRSSGSSRRGSSDRTRWRWPSTSATTDRLIGTCAFSQLDGENGSALYHITIGESDAWGHGYGTEATQLMVDHAFGTLGLHRIALFVFEFNERAIRAYRRCGFVIEGRSRESIWRDGRWWDELAMSVLESDWRRRRARRASMPMASAAGRRRREPTASSRSRPGASDLLRRTFGRLR